MLVFIVDEAFPLIHKEYIPKPYAHKGQTEVEYICSKRLSRSQRIIKNAFGIITNKFRVLSFEIEFKPKKEIKIVLHASLCLFYYLM